MKKLIIISSLLLSISTFAQETASVEGKKMFVGLAYTNLTSENQHWGVTAGLDYFVKPNISVLVSYTYGYSTSERSNDNLVTPTLRQSSKFGTVKMNNHFHIFNIIPTYYIIGGNDATMNVYAGAGPSLTFIRSSEYTPGNYLGKWSGLFLATRVGIDYAAGPGKLFGEAGLNTRMFYFGTDEKKSAYEYNINLNIGYRMGF
ncbi:MAG: hypothetical protein NW207_11295 [Cytophagales bacterium]|nr:hypothetical protein [Cytophagales bacterium]